MEFPIWLSVTEFLDKNSRYFSGFIYDLSVEKSNLQKMRCYEHILEKSLNEIYIFNADSLKFIHINKGALLNLKYTFDELKDKTPIDLKPEFDEVKFNNLIFPLINGDLDKINFTTIQRRKDGTTYPVEVHLELTEFDNQKAFIAIIIDISEKLKALEKIRADEDLIAHMDRISIFGEMVAGIAHELNQPLTAINTYSNAGINRLKKSESDTHKIIELFQKVGDASHRASEIIASLRLMLKPKAKEIGPLNLNKLIIDTIEMVRLDTRANDFKFILNLSDNLPDVAGDSIQIQQVILNLLKNSIDATIDSEANFHQIIISTTENQVDNNVVVSIRDCGSGIAINNEDNIFTPFFTTKESGLGIGLTICQTIIQAHNGRLWYTSNADNGVTFHFMLHSI
jgi:PAS domain S-box-containing protein